MGAASGRRALIHPLLGGQVALVQLLREDIDIAGVVPLGHHNAGHSVANEAP